MYTEFFFLCFLESSEKWFFLLMKLLFNGEEKDLAIRLKRNGYLTYFVPDSEIIHYGGQSTRQMPVKMFIELHKSQVKFYRNHYSKTRAWLLSLSWGLVLWNNLLVSLPLYLIGKRQRLRLFFNACKSYPRILKLILLESDEHTH